MLGQNPQEEKIEIRNKSKSGSLVGVLLLLVALAGYVLFSRSLAEGVEAVEVKITEQTQEVEDIKTQIDEYKAAEERYGLSTDVERRASLRSIPVGVNQDDIIRDLLEITEAYDIELNSLSFGKGVAGDLGSLRINSSFEGNYSDLISFLEGIEQNARLIRVNSIGVQVSEVDILDLERVTFSLSMEAFFQQ